jgi:formylglycine-generating enzyme required for sulfatase activity
MFVVGAGAHDAIEGSVSMLGGEVASQVQIVERAGDAKRCQIGGRLQPGCDVPLRLELTSIGGQEGAAAAARVAEDRSRPPPPVLGAGRACPASMAAIPGGPFIMGSDSLHRVSQPAHRVTVRPFCLDLTEVTVGAYQRCVEAAVCRSVEPKRVHDSCFAATADRTDYPRNCVSWSDARTYCEWQAARLPTEAEWEYAARGGDRSLRYPWGNEAPSDLLLCYKRTIPAGDTPCRVGSFPPEAFGLRDLGGNLQEWTWDWYGPFQAGPAVDPTGPPKGRYHVAKGGYWLTDSETIVSGAWRTDGRGADVFTGIRCARDR